MVSSGAERAPRREGTKMAKHLTDHLAVAERIHELLSIPAEPIAVDPNEGVHSGIQESWFRVVTTSGRILFVSVREPEEQG